MPNKPNLISHRGKSLTVDQWSEATGIPSGTIRHRIYSAGWPIGRALDTPVQIKFRPSPTMRGPQRGAGRPVPKLRRSASGSAFIRWQTAGRRHERTFGDWGLSGYRAETLHRPGQGDKTENRTGNRLIGWNNCQGMTHQI